MQMKGKNLLRPTNKNRRPRQNLPWQTNNGINQKLSRILSKSSARSHSKRFVQSAEFFLKVQRDHIAKDSYNKNCQNFPQPKELVGEYYQRSSETEKWSGRNRPLAPHSSTPQYTDREGDVSRGDIIFNLSNLPQDKRTREKTGRAKSLASSSENKIRPNKVGT